MFGDRYQKVKNHKKEQCTTALIGLWVLVGDCEEGVGVLWRVKIKNLLCWLSMARVSVWGLGFGAIF